MHDGHGFQLEPNLAPEQQLSLDNGQAIDTGIPDYHVLQDDADAHASPEATRIVS